MKPEILHLLEHILVTCCASSSETVAPWESKQIPLAVGSPVHSSARASSCSPGKTFFRVVHSLLLVYQSRRVFGAIQ